MGREKRINLIFDIFNTTPIDSGFFYKYKEEGLRGPLTESEVYAHIDIDDKFKMLKKSIWFWQKKQLKEENDCSSIEWTYEGLKEYRKRRKSEIKSYIKIKKEYFEKVNKSPDKLDVINKEFRQRISEAAQNVIVWNTMFLEIWIHTYGSGVLEYTAISGVISAEASLGPRNSPKNEAYKEFAAQLVDKHPGLTAGELWGMSVNYTRRAPFQSSNGKVYRDSENLIFEDKSGKRSLIGFESFRKKLVK